MIQSQVAVGSVSIKECEQPRTKSPTFDKMVQKIRYPMYPMVWVSGWADGHRGFLVFFHGKLLCRFCFALCYIVLPYSLLVWTVKEEMDISTTSRLTALFSPDLGSDRPDCGESERERDGERQRE